MAARPGGETPSYWPELGRQLSRWSRPVVRSADAGLGGIRPHIDVLFYSGRLRCDPTPYQPAPQRSRIRRLLRSHDQTIRSLTICPIYASLGRRNYSVVSTRRVFTSCLEGVSVHISAKVST